MKLNKIIYTFFFFLLMPIASFSQASTDVEMADVLRRDGKIYTVVIGLVIVLTVMIFYLIRLDRKMHKLEEKD